MGLCFCENIIMIVAIESDDIPFVIVNTNAKIIKMFHILALAAICKPVLFFKNVLHAYQGHTRIEK